MNQPIADGGPAFPVTASTGDPRDGVYCRDGMSLRDWFAGQALSGLCSNANVIGYSASCGFEIVNTDQIGLAAFSISLADAMIAARKEAK